MDKAKVGVVILTYNSQKYIKECLASFLKSSYREFKILVVDNASSDKTVTIIQTAYPSVHIIKNSRNFYYAKGNNIGVKYFLQKEEIDYILLINDDTVANLNLIQQLLVPFQQNKDIGITGPIITYHQDPDKIWYAGGYYNKLFCYTRHPYMYQYLSQVKIKSGFTDFITGCCMMVKREVFGKVGLFDVDYKNYFEDAHFCLVARKYGFLSYLVAKPLLLHRISSSTGRQGSNRLTSYRAYFFARNNFLYIKKQVKGFWQIPNYLGQFFIRLPYYACQMIRDGDFRALQSYLKGMHDGVRFNG